MNPLKSGWEAVKLVKGRKGLFVLLVLIQILFLVLTSVMVVKYQIAIYENIRGVMEPLEGMNYEEYNPEDIQDMMGKITSVTQNYGEMVKNIFTMLFLILGFFLVFNGLLWSLTNSVVNKGRKVVYWGRFVLASVVFLVPISLVSYFVLKSLIGIEMELFGQGVKIIGGVWLVVSYFMLIGFCLIDLKVKELFKKIFVIGFRKAHWMLLGLFFVLGSAGLSLFLIYLAMDKVFLMLLGFLMLVVVMVLGKLFLIGVVRELKGNIY